MDNNPSLKGKEIEALVQERLKAYDSLSVLEQYAMFMGKAQILEFGLKGLLVRKYGLDLESTEKWTMGRVKDELEKQGLRKDFILLLKGVVEYRNYIAHEFLLKNAITQSIAHFSERKLYGDLFRAVYEIEQIVILYNWCEEHDGW